MYEIRDSTLTLRIYWHCVTYYYDAI